MKIALIGSHNTGKSTLIDQFLKQWPMYKKPEKTYRDIIKEKNIKLNKEASAESQRAILDALVDEVQNASTSEDKFIIFDRCPIDNIAYSLWHYRKETPGFDENYIMDCKTIAAFAMKHIDVMFYLPVRKEIPLTPREGREIDETYREEIDNIYNAMVLSYERNTGAFFPKEDSPAVIRLDGPPDLRLPQIKLYIKDNGCGFGEEDGSLIASAEI